MLDALITHVSSTELWKQLLIKVWLNWFLHVSVWMILCENNIPVHYYLKRHSLSRLSLHIASLCFSLHSCNFCFPTLHSCHQLLQPDFIHIQSILKLSVELILVSVICNFHVGIGGGHTYGSWPSWCIVSSFLLSIS